MDCREIFRQLLQDHLGLRAKEEPRRLLVVGDEGVERREVISSGTGLDTIFGEVGVGRLAYRAPRKGLAT